MDNRPIGVFDSGLGGLTTVRELRSRLPGEDIIYFGDTGRVPYGTRSKDTIIRYARQDIRFLKTFDIKALVIACGTASSVALPVILKDYDIPIIGVVDGAAKRAARVTKNKRIGIIGTRATIISGSYEKALKNFDGNIETVSNICSLFVPLVENGRIHRGDKVLELVAEEYLSKIRDFGVDTLIMGCTHYPIIADTIGAIMGDSVVLINPGYEAADSLSRLENIEKSGRQRGISKFFVSDDIQSFEIQASLFLGSKVEGSVSLVNIDEI